MNWNETGMYKVTDGDITIVDLDSQEEMLYVIDRENKIVIRSMMESDIEACVEVMDNFSRDEKEKIKKELEEKLPKKDSQFRYFVIEKIVGKERTKNWDKIYGLKKVPIGIGRKNLFVSSFSGKLTMREGIEMFLCTKEEKNALYVQESLKTLATFLGISTIKLGISTITIEDIKRK